MLSTFATFNISHSVLNLLQPVCCRPTPLSNGMTALIKVTNDLHVTKSKGQFSILISFKLLVAFNTIASEIYELK